jgi:two-component system, NarL family, nitrate/nitrite response regulator NarL
VTAIRVLLADDHSLFRKGVAGALADHSDIEIVGEATDGLQVINKARELNPDVILMDICMPGMNGLEATRQIKAEFPELKIVILTIAEEDQNLFEAIKSGAQGYLLKDVEPQHLVEMLRGVFRGEAPISRAAAAKILIEFSRQAREANAGDRSRTDLTAREREVLGLVAGGATNKDIAAGLGISPSTAKNHLQNILAKLHLENRVQAAAFAVREGLAPARPEQS